MQGRVQYRFGRFTLDPADERLIGPGGPIKLGNKAFRVLLTLVEQQGRLVTKDSLFETVWDGTIVSESALTSVIKELRRALGDDARAPDYIESAYGRGYRFLGAAERAQLREMSFGAARSPAAKREQQRPPLLVVTPIEDGAVRSTHPFLSSGIRAELLLALSRLREIRLVAGSARSPQLSGGQTLTERDYQLQLTLLAQGDDVRVFVNLSSLATNVLLWSGTAELGREQGRGVERLIRRIVSEGLSRLYKDVLRSAPVEPDGIYDRYFANQLRMRAQSSFVEAKDVAQEWEAIIKEEPEFAPAYPPLIRLYNTDYCYCGLGSTGTAERSRADALADVMITLDPSNAHFKIMKGFCNLWADRADAARACFEESLALNPYHQARLIELAIGFIFLDELDRGATLLDEYEALTPFATETPHEDRALLSLMRGDYANAEKHGLLARRKHPDDLAGSSPTVFGHLYGILGAAASGRADFSAQAYSWLDGVRRRWHDPETFSTESLRRWVSYQMPFTNVQRTRFVQNLLEPVLEVVPIQARPGQSSPNH